MLRLGMIGGGSGAFIGAVHRTAACMDAEARFVAGCLSSTPDRAIASGKCVGLPDDRNYPTWRAMLDAERTRPSSQRLDAVVIVTPNHLHHDIALEWTRAGFHVACDKPLTRTLDEAHSLARAVDDARTQFCVTYNYSGYPLVQTARELVRSGVLGPVRKVFAEYHQGWLARDLAASGQKQAAWRADPSLAGAGALGDIGTHAEHLLRTITGLSIESLCADVTSFVPGRRVDDDASVLLRLTGGARGVLTCSQVCVGAENSLSIRVHGERGSLKWKQENPNVLTHLPEGEPARLITRASAAAGEHALPLTRLPPGHPEGFIEAFANIYRGFFSSIRCGATVEQSASAIAFPTIHDGVEGVRFVTRALESAARGGEWVSMR
jgi:predicted dehydrogenase